MQRMRKRRRQSFGPFVNLDSRTSTAVVAIKSHNQTTAGGSVLVVVSQPSHGGRKYNRKGMNENRPRCDYLFWRRCWWRSKKREKKKKSRKQIRSWMIYKTLDCRRVSIDRSTTSESTLTHRHNASEHNWDEIRRAVKIKISVWDSRSRKFNSKLEL